YVGNTEKRQTACSCRQGLILKIVFVLFATSSSSTNISLTALSLSVQQKT
ncbi:hypothetical protein DOY81_011265, partial [Sarcophaga bullata]